MDFSHVRPSSLGEEERMVNSFVIMVGQSRFPCSGPVSFVGKTQDRQLRREILGLKKKKKKLFLKNLIDESDGRKMNLGQYIFQIQAMASQSERPMDFLPKVALDHTIPC